MFIKWVGRGAGKKVVSVLCTNKLQLQGNA
jgi:hypothetical protein